MAAVDAAEGIDEALAAYRSNRIVEARSGYALVAGDDAAAPRDRAVAARELARSAWLIDGDEAAARAILASPAAWEDDSCATAALLVRILREAGHANEAVEAARRPHASCTQDHDELYVHEARAWADVAHESGRAPRHATEGMANALDNLAVERRHGADASRLDLELGLLTSSPRRAFDGWTRYFWLESESAPPALKGEFPDASAVFERALGPAYGAPLEADLELLRLLVRAGFHREAARFATWRHVERRAREEGGASWPAIASYLRFRAAVERTTLEHNRRLAHGENGGEAYEGAILGLMEQAAGEVAEGTGTTGAPASETLLAAWGVHGTVGLTGGFMSLHAGHVVEDVAEVIEQDGRTGAVRRVVLDNMLANGYESWLWDGWAQAGGWAEEGTRLVQVRPSYVGSIVEALLLRPGRPARARADAELGSLARRDEAVLARHGLADLPGLAQRLKLQAIDQIAADLGASETERDDDTAFQSAYWNALVGGTITIHEGRHVLDQARYRDADALSSEELEYRAKLSELRFAAYPRLDLAKMVVGQIGGESGHGRANSRILRELGTWVEEHAAAVRDLDPHVPCTAQIDNLTDDQLRAFADAAEARIPGEHPEARSG